MSFSVESILSLLIFCSPLLLASTGALISERSGHSAIFMEGIINAGAFACFAFTHATSSRIAGAVLALVFVTVLFRIIFRAVLSSNSNEFIVYLALNLLSGALISLFSFVIFKSRGVLQQTLENQNIFVIRLVTAAAAYSISALLVTFLHATDTGLQLRITGTDKALLKIQKVDTTRLELMALTIAAFCGCACGCVLTNRLEAFVPNIASGTGWLALAAVFLGKKNTALTIVAVFIFSIAQFAATNIQNFTTFQAVPSSLLLALPYLIALVCISIRSKS